METTDYKEKLPDFIDGLLSREEEKAMYAELAVNDELLTEYKVMKSIIDNAASSGEMFAPSAALTNSVFAAVGIEGAAPTPFFRKIIQPKYALHYLAPLAASFALIFAVLWNNKGEKVSEPSGNKTQIASAKTVPAAPAISEEAKLATYNKELLPSSAKNFTQMKEENPPQENADLAQNSEEPDLDMVSSSDFAAEEYVDEDFDEFAEYESDYLLASHNFENDFHSVHSPQLTMANANFGLLPGHFDPDEVTYQKFFNNDNFVVELKNAVYFDADSKSAPSAKFDNLCVDVMYKVSKHFFVGVDLRDESFAVETVPLEGIETFSTRNDLNSADEFNSAENTVDLNVTSVGIIARYIIPLNYKSLQPVADLVAARCSKGFVCRGGVALCYAPSNGISFTLGIEYSNLIYKNVYDFASTAPKYGINYGIAYNF